LGGRSGENRGLHFGNNLGEIKRKRMHVLKVDWICGKRGWKLKNGRKAIPHWGPKTEVEGGGVKRDGKSSSSKSPVNVDLNWLRSLAWKQRKW